MPSLAPGFVVSASGFGSRLSVVLVLVLASGQAPDLVCSFAELSSLGLFIYHAIDIRRRNQSVPSLPRDYQKHK